MTQIARVGRVLVQIFPGSIAGGMGWVTEQRAQVEASQSRRVKTVSA